MELFACLYMKHFGPQYGLMPMNENYDDVKFVVGEVVLRNLEPCPIGLSLSSSM